MSGHSVTPEATVLIGGGVVASPHRSSAEHGAKAASRPIRVHGHSADKTKAGSGPMVLSPSHATLQKV